MFTKIDEIKKVIGKQKGSLLFSNKVEQDEWFKSIKTNPAYQPLLAEIIEEAERLLQEPVHEIPFSTFSIFRDKGLRLEYEKVYFEKRNRLNVFALMTLIEPNQSIYQEQLQDSIWSICNEYTWCLPAHLKNSPEMDSSFDETMLGSIYNQQYTIDLFASETAFTLSEIYKLTENFLDPLIQKRMVEEIYRRVLLPFCNQPSFHWETSTHNWAAVCAGSIGAAALHLINDEERLTSILERVLHSLNYYLQGFNEDGTCMEGYGYWQYGFGYFTYFADLLKKKTDGALNLFTSEKVHHIALFQQKCFIHRNQVVNFSDSTEKATVFLGLSHYLKDIYSDVEVPEEDLRAPFTADHCSRWAPAFRNLLWFNENETGKPWQNATYYMSDSQWLISRNDRLVFACKGGHNDEPHNHNDIGHFILQADGETLLKDLGSGMYCDGYFGEERYSFLCNGSQGHSVPIINNQFQAEGISHFATITDVSLHDDIDRVEIEMTKAYEIKSLEKLVRTFSWKKKDDNRKLILSDAYLFKETPSCIIERFIAPVLHVTEEQDGVILKGKRKLKIIFDRSMLDFDYQEAEFINHSGKVEKLLMLDFKVNEPKSIVQLEFRFQLL
ncbi:heparinase II/III family protein [Bacillus sp. PS06]|uniref:heparinase II/III family protein n=1 Tax=Bacillus sp. PS06 TaxID=2764176 RepID=UPI00177F41F5|nr:heparinase II/III family protein [Bacillus sp. PS06]MBD8068656.1 heparinase II/III family protein [Bacillus sp. PS06]